MKRILICLLAILLLASLACNKAEEDSSPAAQNDPTAPGEDSSALPQNDNPAPGGETVEPEPATPPPPEEPEYEPLPAEYLPLSERVRGDWYADEAGLVITLALTEEGYTLSVPGEQPKTGKWEAKDGVIVLGGDEENPLTPIGDVIRFDAMDLLFTREMPTVYIPADVIADAGEGSFDGFYKAQFVAVGEGTILAAAAEEDAYVYIEGTNVALGGTRFGNVIKVFTAVPGALTLAEDGLNVKLELQEDGFLRMTLPDAVIYMIPAVIPGTEPETP